METDWISVILGALLGLNTLAVAIVNLTPTPKDDEFVGKLYRIVEIVAGLWTRRAKELPGEAALYRDAAGPYLTEAEQTVDRFLDHR